MKRHVFVIMDIAMAHPARASLRDRLPECEPEVFPYGGVKRRVRLTVDSTDAFDAGRTALEKLALVASDWGDVGDAFVDEIKRVEPVDPAWEKPLPD